MPTPRPPRRQADDLTQTAEPIGAGEKRVVMQAYLFLALDGGMPARGSARWSLAGVAEIGVGRGPARVERRQDGARWVLDMQLDGPQISRDHARIERTSTGWTVRDLG